MECKEVIEETIRQNFDGMHLKHDIVGPLVEQFGSDRMTFVLVNTLTEELWDERFSNDNKDWSGEFYVADNFVQGRNMNQELVISRNPTVLNEFIDMFRREVLEQEREQQGDEIIDLGEDREQVLADLKAKAKEREDDQTMGQESKKVTVTLTVAECSEYHNLGEFHENIPTITNEPKAMELVAEIMAKLPEMEVDGKMSEELEAKVWEKRMPDLSTEWQLALAIDRLSHEYDPVLYRDSVQSMTENVAELEEQNYNMIDNVLNNGVEKSREGEEGKDPRGAVAKTSLRDRLAEKKRQVVEAGNDLRQQVAEKSEI